MHETIATVTLPHLTNFHDYHYSSQNEYLSSTLAALARLKELDALLSEPQFSLLRHVELIFTLSIFIEDVPGATDASHTLSEKASNPNVESDSRNAERTFEHYAEDLIRCKILEELEQFRARGELEIRLRIFALRRDVGEEPKTGSQDKVNT